MNKKTSPSRPERGQSLVEFAISLTAILILLAGAVDFGIGLFHYIAMRDAAQEGALYGSMNPSNTTEIGNRIKNSGGGSGMIYDLYTSGDLTSSVTYLHNGNPTNSSSACEGDTIRVELDYNYPLSMPFIGTFIGSDHITLRAIVSETILTPVC